MTSLTVLRRAVATGSLALLLAAPSGPALAEATPEATLWATPAAIPPGCDGLGPYFQAVAALTRENDGLATMEAHALGVQAFTEVEAARVVAALDDLVPQVAAITPPEPARAWHVAYLELLAWYRDLAANRDPIAHQRLVNDDRRVLIGIGQAVLKGQAACGYETWMTAWDAAFPPEE